jgi:hypothetical protein
MMLSTSGPRPYANRLTEFSSCIVFAFVKDRVMK